MRRGRSAGETGGTIAITGDKVGLVDRAVVDASGHAGGGSVLVGGDYQGKNAAVRNASRTYVGPDATIRVDAIVNGDGGKAIVWADDATQFYGAISARGGPAGGNGGFVETSGKAVLESTGIVDASAVQRARRRVALGPEQHHHPDGGSKHKRHRQPELHHHQRQRHRHHRQHRDGAQRGHERYGDHCERRCQYAGRQHHGRQRDRQDRRRERDTHAQRERTTSRSTRARISPRPRINSTSASTRAARSPTPRPSIPTAAC